MSRTRSRTRAAHDISRNNRAGGMRLQQLLPLLAALVLVTLVLSHRLSESLLPSAAATAAAAAAAAASATAAATTSASLSSPDTTLASALPSSHSSLLLDTHSSKDAALSTVAASDVSADASSPAPSLDAQDEMPKEADSSAIADAATYPSDCPSPRRPYHVLLTASSGQYQFWQTRIFHHHYLRMRAMDRCGEVGGFTRLLTLPEGRAEDSLSDEMRTIVVAELKKGEDLGFVVLNR
eukprot:6196097-Pleurochrysis_carterae.AAC.3